MKKILVQVEVPDNWEVDLLTDEQWNKDQNRLLKRSQPATKGDVAEVKTIMILIFIVVTMIFCTVILF